MGSFPGTISRQIVTKVAIALAIGLGFTSSAALHAQQDSSVAVGNCLKAWGKHPFSANPTFRTMPVAVKVFGIGGASIDSVKTSAPELILVKPSVNVMGGSTVELRNPNGWYCFVTNVNVMGKMKIKAHCSAHLAQSHDGVTVMGTDSNNKSVAVMGKTEVQLLDCPGKDDTQLLPRQTSSHASLAAARSPFRKS